MKSGWAQAGWAAVRAAVPLLKALVGGKLAPAEPEAAAWVCSALARVCGRGSEAARAYAVFVFKEGALPPSLRSHSMPLRRPWLVPNPERRAQNLREGCAVQHGT